ncbi:hypothetical protein [Pontibacter ruber]|uniref:Anti-sigma factor n=1 Tax=Pontibacter ruber TaxID=1343895 RepID=A0ABW5CUL7_9BACT|nr:hypothetical protein [Pontibacter ruber]
MKEGLEKFVSEHRDEFDVFEPRPELWQKICPHVPPIEQVKDKKEAKVISFSFGERASFSADMFFMRVAAAIILLLGCGLTLFLMKQNTPEAAYTIAATTEQAKLRKIAPELVEVEAYYTSQIEEKKSQLTEYDLKVLGLDEQQDIDRELARLDSSYTQLKKQLYTTPNTDKVMGAMIQNLQIRIEVLNRQLEVLQRIEKLQKQRTTQPQKDETSNV